MRTRWKKMIRFFSGVGIVDRFLLVFMLVLFGCMVTYLFTSHSEGNQTVNTLVKTSAASVFGYFISANFLKTNATQTTEEPETRSVDEAPVKAAKALSTETAESVEKPVLPEQQLPDTIQTTAPTENRNKMQILIVSLIGLLSLVALLVSYSMKNESSGFVSTVSQLRDFVSTCIGFLISYRKNEAV